MKPTLSDKNIYQNYYHQIMEHLTQDPFARFLGITLNEVKEGSATAEITVADHMLNAHGTVHGAVIFSLADYVFAAASNSYGRTAVGLSTNVNFMSPGKKGSTITATATEEKRNKRMSWYQIRVESDGELLAVMQATAYRKQEYFVPVTE